MERAGDKIQDLLHKSNPWEDQDCLRKSCPTCSTSLKSDKCEFKSCSKRSVVYETWCQTCVIKEEKELRRKYDVFEERLDLDKLYADKKVTNSNSKRETGMKRKIEGMGQDEILKFKYIGESSRSAYERGVEHYKDLEYTRPKSHMLKHAVIHHPDLDPRHIDFRMKILSFHQSAFERQIKEAVLIHRNSVIRSMNSKLEYNRCSIPRIIMKTGNKEDTKDMMVDIEKTANERIKILYDKKETKRTGENIKNIQTRKKRKVGSENPLLFLTHKHSSSELEEINLHQKLSTKSMIQENSQTRKSSSIENEIHEPDIMNSFLESLTPEELDRPLVRSCQPSKGLTHPQNIDELSLHLGERDIGPTESLPVLRQNITTSQAGRHCGPSESCQLPALRQNNTTSQAVGHCPSESCKLPSKAVGHCPSESGKLPLLSSGERSKLSVNSRNKSPLGKINVIADSRTKAKRRMVLRGEIQLRSPRSPKSPILKRRKESSIEKQRHLLSAKKSTSNTVAKLINAFEHNSTNCDVISQNKTKISELDLSCINKGSVKDAFALLMLRKGVDLTPKTPRRKNVKRLDKEKTTSDQKRIDAWVRK